MINYVLISFARAQGHSTLLCQEEFKSLHPWSSRNGSPENLGRNWKGNGSPNLEFPSSLQLWGCIIYIVGGWTNPSENICSSSWIIFSEDPGEKYLSCHHPLIGNPYNGYIIPYYWVDDHPSTFTQKDVKQNSFTGDPPKRPWDSELHMAQVPPRTG